ncbi:hypothetical protein [Hyphomicrobium sp. MC1]|uniref:hypothetical protein n=1 Tax=Hyphomicrobium sp. (strain MC1) TaxID=717785 RepID=UPI000213F779|nr:hypothetical protein [Hyphomicrobium sp. MC1]CCB63718.1 conserved exported protein of unknown function [Hyphomicrobium sp. MC1]
MTHRLSIFALALVIAAGLNGCSEEQPTQRQAEQRSGLTKVGTKSWLTEQDDVKPEIWLIEHEAKSDGKVAAPKSGEVRRALIEASEKFNDSPRMVANRAVQLEDMLKGAGGDETAISLITMLNNAIAANRIESFGAAGQQYYNLRKAGFTGEEALDALSKRYGSRS